MIPIKKVQLSSIGLSSYGENQIKLQFLPKVVAYLGAFLVVLAFLFYFNLAGLAFPAFNSKSSTPESFINVNKNLVFQSGNTGGNSFDSKIQNVGYLDSENFCKFVSQKSVTQELIFNSPESGFWLPENCITNVLFLQILKLNPEDVVKLSQNPTTESFLISNNIYLLAYKSSQEASGLDFQPYLVDLSQPVFPSEISFIEATSYDMSTSNNLKFYLVGECQDFKNNNCKLWLLDTETGRRSIIFTDFLQLLTNNKLPAKTVIKFAKIQDSTPTAVNIIIHQQTEKSIILVRIGLANSLPIQSLVINRSDQSSVFNKYYR